MHAKGQQLINTPTAHLTRNDTNSSNFHPLSLRKLAFIQFYYAPSHATPRHTENRGGGVIAVSLHIPFTFFFYFVLFY